MYQQRRPEQTKSKHWQSDQSFRKLPSFPLDLMTQGQLREFIPQLVRMVYEERNACYDKNKISKPQWWPPDVSWDMQMSGTKKILQHSKIGILRRIVHNCYKYHGKENLLTTNRPSPIPTRVPLACPPAHSFCAQENVTLNTDTVHLPVSPRQTFSEIYICFFCEEEFYNKAEMRQHQAACMERPPELQAIGTPSKSKKQQDIPLLSPKKKLFDKPRPTKDVYIKAVHLIPTVKAEQIRARARKSTEIDCDIIDLEEPMSPTTPKTPTSLMSQLSRDLVASSRKRLSYSEASQNDHDSVHSCGSEELDEAAKQKEKQSLLNIAVSSLLGQRIQKHVAVEMGYQVCSDREAFCKTPEKNEFLDRLRNRTIAYNITFRRRKQMDTTYYHTYKFSSKQRKDSRDEMRTGLNVCSRKLLKTLPKCFVILERLSEEEISEWVPLCAFSKKKKAVKSETDDAIFPVGPVLLDSNIDQLLGLKRRSEDRLSHCGSRPLALENVVSEHVNAEVSKQKLTLYRSLLSEFSMKPVYINLQHLKLGKKQAGPKSHNNSLKMKSKKKSKKYLVKQNTLKTKFSVVVLDDIAQTLDGKSIINISGAKLSDSESLNRSVCRNLDQQVSKDVKSSVCNRSLQDLSKGSSHAPKFTMTTKVMSFKDWLSADCDHKCDDQNCTCTQQMDLQENRSGCQQVIASVKSSPVKFSFAKLQPHMFLDKLHIKTDIEALQRSLPSPASSTKSDPVCDGVPHLTINGTLSEPATPYKHKLHSVRRVIDMDNFATHPCRSDNETDNNFQSSKHPLNICNIPPAKVRKTMTEPSIVTV